MTLRTSKLSSKKTHNENHKSTGIEDFIMPVMTVEEKALFLENVDDGTGNPQRGYFAIFKMVGPFTSQFDADEYIKNNPD